MSTEVYGHSDDCLCVTGDLHEEFHPDDGEISYLGFSDGTLLSAAYTAQGVWCIRAVVKGPGFLGRVEGNPDDDCTDSVRIGGAKWVVFGNGNGSVDMLDV